jgi:hypothetical protein
MSTNGEQTPGVKEARCGQDQGQKNNAEQNRNVLENKGVAKM